MTVTVSKPAVNLREELSALKKISGIKGEELLRANTVADVYASLNLTMFRNRLINGDMRIWQRGVTTTPGSGYSADMFRFEPRNGTTIYSDRSADVPAGQGFTYSMRTYATGATDDGFHIRSYVELPAAGVYGEFQPGTQWTVSFWMKSAYASRTVNVTVGLAETAVGGSHQSQGIASSQGTQFVTNQWKKYVFNFTLPAWVADAGSLSNVRCFYVRLLQGSDDLPQDTYVTGVQLERGAVATPFEVRPIGTELASCMRYFYAIKSTGVGNGDGTGLNGVIGGNTAVHRSQAPHPVIMRATPSLTFSNISTQGTDLRVYDAGVSPNITSVGSNFSNANAIQFDCTASSGGLTTGRAAVILWSNSITGGYIWVSAEL